MSKLQGKIALVTGAASGIGLGIAQRFVKEGAQVVITDIDVKKGIQEAAALGPAVRFHELDVATESGWQAVLSKVKEEFSVLDILVNNAGVTLMGSIEDVSVEDFDKTMAINLRGPFLGSKYFIPLMKNRDASIINIASVSSFKPLPELVAYNASKAAVALMTKSIALHCGRSGSGIRVNSINPGVILTDMLEKVMQQVEDGDALMESYRQMHPIGFIGDPGDIAGMAVFLASDEGRFITGAAFTVDGGLGINS